MHETRRKDDAKTSQDGCPAVSGVSVAVDEKGRAGSSDRTSRRNQPADFVSLAGRVSARWLCGVVRTQY